MEKESQQEHGKGVALHEVDKLLDDRKYVRKPLPKIPDKTWEAFEKFAQEECGSDWGMAFDRLVREALIEPEWLDMIMSLRIEVEKNSEEINGLKEEEKKPVAEPQEEKIDLGSNAMGESFKEMVNDG